MISSFWRFSNFTNPRNWRGIWKYCVIWEIRKSHISVAAYYYRHTEIQHKLLIKLYLCLSDQDWSTRLTSIIIIFRQQCKSRVINDTKLTVKKLLQMQLSIIMTVTKHFNFCRMTPKSWICIKLKKSETLRMYVDQRFRNRVWTIDNYGMKACLDIVCVPSSSGPWEMVSA